MSWINSITKENFEQSFDLIKILKQSTFYPASGIDFNNIEGLLQYSNSFIHVDYLLSADRVEEALRSDILYHGFELIGIRQVALSELTPNELEPVGFPLKDGEEERISKRNQATYYNNYFCFWAVYELGIDGQFSVLHIGSEACEIFDALYVKNKINPTVVAIINPGEGFGDNWTVFRNPDHTLFKSMQLNSEENKISLPQYVYTNMTLQGRCFWPNYELINRESLKRQDSNEVDEYFTFIGSTN
jgi:hypothetical protein